MRSRCTLKTAPQSVDEAVMDFSAGALIVMMIASSIGFGLFVYGKKQARLPQLIAGIGLMGYPYFVAGALWMTVVAAVMLLAMWGCIRAGL